MANVFHPARLMPYQTLIDGLLEGKRAGTINRRHDRESGLTFYMYSSPCVYDKLWNEFSSIARGLILDEKNRRIVATPFPKFFNYGEFGVPVPEGSFEVFDKLDGSLIILFYHNGVWRTSTKLDIHSPQSAWAQQWIEQFDLSSLDTGTTYLCEATYPENRIVVRHENPALSLLGAYAADGRELEFEELVTVGHNTGLPVVARQSFDSFEEMVQHAEKLPASAEGFVARWSDGTRLKIKGAEYRRIHALICGVTPLGIFNLIAAEDDLEAVRKVIPEEFWGDFDDIVALLSKEIEIKRSRIETMVDSVSTLSDKEIGLTLKDHPADVRGYLFPFRKHGWSRIRKDVLRDLRPTGNKLVGYTPSYKLANYINEAV